MFLLWKIFKINITVLGASLLWIPDAVNANGDTSCMDVMRRLVTNDEAGGKPVSQLTEECYQCQGKPGKMGIAGPPGPVGTKGDRGEAGPCSCDLGEVERLKNQIEDMKADFNRKLRLIPGSYVICEVGIENGDIPISDITASNTHSTCPLANIRLNSGGAWCSLANAAGTWVQVDLKTTRNVTGIVTQGRNGIDQWVKTYKISHGTSVTNLKALQVDGVDKIFQGNIDSSTPVENLFPAPVLTRYIRIYPDGFSSWMSMRIELLEC